MSRCTEPDCTRDTDQTHALHSRDTPDGGELWTIGSPADPLPDLDTRD